MRTREWILGMGILVFGSCQVEQNPDTSSDDSTVESEEVLSQYSETGNNFRVSLTDAPNKELSKVYVNIKEVLLKVGGSGNKKAEVKIAQNVGIVDLLTLQDGVMMEMADLSLPVGMKVNQIRLILEDYGNSIEYVNGATCNLQTPSQQNTGLKLVSPEINIEEGKSYSLVVDFDAKKSIVHQGNGGCLLKPVLKWGGISSVSGSDDEDEDVIAGPDDGDYSEEDSEDESENNSNDQDDDSDNGLPDCLAVDFDLYDVTTWPEDFVFDDYAHCY